MGYCNLTLSIILIPLPVCTILFNFCFQLDLNLATDLVHVKMPLFCRFYEERFPEIEDVVMVNVSSIADMGAYVHLLEYNSIEGMILLSELSRRRIRSINKLIRVGRNECVVVIRVDKDKGKFSNFVKAY